MAHFLDGHDEGQKTVKAIVYTSVAVGTLISTGIFALRASVDGPLGGLIYGALAAGIAGASFISSYVYADDAADAIDAAEKSYDKATKRYLKLAGHTRLERALCASTEAESIKAEHSARGKAATAAHEGLKHRVLRRNPGVAGHRPAENPPPIIGSKARSKGAK